jgi:hypothetical protein
VGDILVASEQVGHPGLAKPRYVDSLEVDLSAPESLADGRHEFSCRFAWKNEGLTSTIVPVQVNVAHPYCPVLGEIFCGEIAPGATWERSLRMVRHGARASGDLRVRSIQSDTAGVSAEYSQETDCLLLRVAPKNAAGRFESNLALVYSDPRIPDFHLKVSGIVRRDE